MYIYNETLDQFYSLDSDSLMNIQRALRDIFELHKWSFDHKIHIINDYDWKIEESKIL